MNHEVVWTVEAYRSLEAIWDAAYDREQVAYAVDEVLEQLGVDAETKGESRTDGTRVFFAKPLGVLFWAISRTTEVLIFDVWTFG